MPRGQGGFSNLAQWRAAIKEIGGGDKTPIRKALPLITRHLRDTVRNHVPPGSASKFPGYASTGTLRENIVAGPVREVGKRFHSSVGLSSRATKLTRIKAFVHENGMTIHARRFKYMTFRIGGKWIKAQSVRIRPKHFFRDGWAEGRANFPATLERYVRQTWLTK